MRYVKQGNLHLCILFRHVFLSNLVLVITYVECQLLRINFVNNLDNLTGKQFFL